MGHRHLEIQIPLEHSAYVGQLAGHLECLHQELRLLVLGDVAAVVVARRWGRIGAVPEFGQPDLLGRVAILNHDVVVLAQAGKGEEAVVGVVSAGQTALGRIRRAVRWVRKSARVSRQRVEVADHLSAVERIQLLEIAEVVDDRAGNVGPGWTGRSQQYHGVRITGLDPGVAGLEQRQVCRRIDVAQPGLAIEVLLVPQLVRLDLTRVARGDGLHELAERARVGWHEPAGIGAIKGRRMGEAQHDPQARFGSVADDVVQV